MAKAVGRLLDPPRKMRGSETRSLLEGSGATFKFFLRQVQILRGNDVCQNPRSCNTAQQMNNLRCSGSSSELGKDVPAGRAHSPALSEDCPHISALSTAVTSCQLMPIFASIQRAKKRLASSYTAGKDASEVAAWPGSTKVERVSLYPSPKLVKRLQLHRGRTANVESVGPLPWPCAYLQGRVCCKG
jgi:hypothetical protein